MTKRILVIDDEEAVRITMRRLLDKAGYRALLASGGEEAISLLEKEQVDLIMLDMNMPGMNGLHVLEAIRDRQLTRVPVLMVTGTSDAELRARSYQLGAYDFITKPEQVEIMLKRVENGIKIGEMIHFTDHMHIELLMAQKLQKYLYPEPQCRNEHFGVSIWSRALSEIGGDVYDYVQLRNGRFMFLVADVSGHGIAAALYTAIVKVVFRNALKESDDPGLILLLMNRELTGNIPTELFITIFCGQICPATRMLRYANAGHPWPYIVSGEGVELLGGDDSFIGPIPDARFRTFDQPIDGLRSLYVFTDGILEMKEEAPPGKSLFLSLLETPDASPDSVLETFQESVEAHGMTDDCTLMAFDFNRER